MTARGRRESWRGSSGLSVEIRSTRTVHSWSSFSRRYIPRRWEMLRRRDPWHTQLGQDLRWDLLGWPLPQRQVKVQSESECLLRMIHSRCWGCLRHLCLDRRLLTPSRKDRDRHVKRTRRWAMGPPLLREWDKGIKRVGMGQGLPKVQETWVLLSPAWGRLQAVLPSIARLEGLEDLRRFTRRQRRSGHTPKTTVLDIPLISLGGPVSRSSVHRSLVRTHRSISNLIRRSAARINSR